MCLPKTSFCLEWLKLQTCGVPDSTALIVSVQRVAPARRNFGERTDDILSLLLAGRISIKRRRHYNFADDHKSLPRMLHMDSEMLSYTQLKQLVSKFQLNTLPTVRCWSFEAYNVVKSQDDASTYSIRQDSSNKSVATPREPNIPKSACRGFDLRHWHFHAERRCGVVDDFTNR